MYQIDVWMHDLSTKRLSFDTYDEFTKGYWEVFDDHKVKLFEVPSNIEGF
jgi:hypothetical protein